MTADPTETPVYHPLLGQRVRVLLAREGDPVGPWYLDDPEPGCRTTDEVAVGILLTVNAGGTAVLLGDDKVTRWAWPALDITAAPTPGPTPAPRRPRLKDCVDRWPGAEIEGNYDPRCCRFPKSCSASVYDDDLVGPEHLEEVTA